MTCLPFGLATAPKAFSMLTNWVAQFLRNRHYIRILVYLDDYLIAHQNANALREHVKITVEVLESLGWQINYEKSVLCPKKSLVYLGIQWQPRDNQKSLTSEKIVHIIGTVESVLLQGKITLKSAQKIVGLLNFASFAVPRGRLNHRHLLLLKISLESKGQKKAVPLPQKVIDELVWWRTNCQLTTPIHYPDITNYLATDASGQAWGCQLNNVALSGNWRKQELYLHSNQKEMLAILYAIRSHAHILRHSSTLIQCDNRTVVAYLKNEGGTRFPPLLTLARQILELIDQYKIHMTIFHIPGRYNSQADHLSRHRRPPEWHLLPTCVNKIFAKWGVPMIDLFASKTAHVVNNYVSRDLRDVEARFHDAFSAPWNFPLAWVFPPPFLVPRVLSHLNQSTGVYLLIVPRWEKVFWRADLKTRALEAPMTLRHLDTQMIDTSTGRPPPKVEDLILEAWRCGAGPRQ
ncbi:unnamed protein product [Euphydryas editha]|uniref:Reverse transcriptase domain-containing protein n=1 Tax=Euphydryas editha TaxID=104508 RepID=A0AAU9TPG8_EUPED|nr:unnamed protein product [Euphydryas editha]